MSTKYIITLPKKEITKNFNTSRLTFTIGKMRSVGVCIVKPILKLYTIKKEEINTYKGKQWVVANTYQKYTNTFNITEEELHQTSYIQIKLEIIGITSDYPIYFNNLMLNEGDYTDYHQPNESLDETSIYFINNFFVNLYTKNEESFLEIIRPNYDNFTTKTIKRSKCTILAPHLLNEDAINSSENLSLEYMNMNEQVIEILR